MWTGDKWDTTEKITVLQKAGQQEPQQGRVTVLSETGQEKTLGLHLFVESKSKTNKQNKPNAQTQRGD